MPLIERWLDRIVVVSDDQVGDAMAELLGEAKLVVEGAGAVGRGRARGRAASSPASTGTTAVVLSGGNIDESLLAAIARRSGARHGRGAVLFTTISDRPGSLARLLEAVGATGASVVDVQARARRRRPARRRDGGRADPRDPRPGAHRTRSIDELASAATRSPASTRCERSDG